MEMEKDYNLMVGLRIREVRETSRLTREQFCERCDLSESFLADVERGKKGIGSASLYRICKSMNISADYLLFGNQNGFDTDIMIELVRTVEDPYKEPLKDIIVSYLQAIQTHKNETSRTP